MSDKAKHADSTIYNHMIWSMGAGFIPVPIADLFAVSAIQLDMIRQMCKIYDIDFKETEGKALITALTGSSLARLGARAVKFIPGVGSILGGVTMAVLSGGSTYALGEVFKKHFETGGTFLDFDPSRLKKYYDEKFEKGKDMASSIQKEKKTMEEMVVPPPPTEEQVEKAVEETVAQTNEPTIDEAPAKPAKRSSVQQLEAIAQLREDGVLTDEEFEIMKKKIIDSGIK